jgi:hypothetical protein
MYNEATDLEQNTAAPPGNEPTISAIEPKFQPLEPTCRAIEPTPIGVSPPSPKLELP